MVHVRSLAPVRRAYHSIHNTSEKVLSDSYVRWRMPVRNFREFTPQGRLTCPMLSVYLLRQLAQTLLYFAHSSSHGRGPGHPVRYPDLGCTLYALSFAPRTCGRGKARTPLSPRLSRGRPPSGLSLSSHRCRRGDARPDRGDHDPQWMGARMH
jgi:hypothetical protein